MATSRYVRTPRLNLGSHLGTTNSISAIRSAIKDGRLTTKTFLLRGRERLDTIAGESYGDASYWWIIAAASDIGWGLQVPPGTIIKVPDLGEALKVVAG